MPQIRQRNTVFLTLLMAFALLLVYRDWKRKKLIASISSQDSDTGNNTSPMVTPTTGLPATSNSTVTNALQPFVAAATLGGYVG
jgi:hypothetical protein